MKTAKRKPVGSDINPVAEITTAANRKHANGDIMCATDAVGQICNSIRNNQRWRLWYQKSRIMIMNRLQATVAGELFGYRSHQGEADREKAWKEAGKAIKSGATSGTVIDEITKNTLAAASGFVDQEERHEAEIIRLLQQLPICKWLEKPEQRGFGLQTLGNVIGETGDLWNYPNPGKLWKRMGCAPFSSDGMTLMGGTWRSGREGKLLAEDWTEYAYSPRRRSVMYVIGENLLRLNGEGPYRTRYNESKAKLQREHPDYKPLRLHRHGMLLASKLLLKNLWIAWREV